MKKNIVFFLFLILFASLNLHAQDTIVQKTDTVRSIIKQNIPLLSIPKLEAEKSTKEKENSTATTSLIENKDKALAKLENVISFGKIISTLLLLIITYLILLLSTKLLTILSEYSARYRILLKRTIPIVRILGWSLAIYAIIAGIFSPPYETVVAFFASVGVAVGFAAQDVLKNIFGGLVILFDRPFQVGDKIEMGGHYGEVIEIGLRSVRVVTADDSVVTIPNAEIMNNSVSNSNSGETNCQVVAEIYLPINIDTKKARRIAIEAAHISKHIFLKKSITIIFINEVKDRRSYLKMRVKAYVSDPRNEFAFKSEMTEEIIREMVAKNMIESI